MKRLFLLCSAFLLCLTASACFQSEKGSSLPESSGSSAAVSGSLAAPQDDKADEASEPQAPLLDAYNKYEQTNDRYLVAQPKSELITTYLYFTPGKGFTTVETPIPDYMITVFDYLAPIEAHMGELQIENIVWDKTDDRICVNFSEDAPLLTGMDEKRKCEILYAITKTIMENHKLAQGVYFEVGKKPLKVLSIYPDLDFLSYNRDIAQKLGTEEDVEEFTGILKSIKPDDVVTLYAEYQPSDYSGVYPLDTEDVERLLEMLKGIVLKPFPYETYGNPPTGGIHSFYIETDHLRLRTGSNGWVFAEYSDRNCTLVFEEAGYSGPAPGPAEYIYQKQQGK